MSIGTIPREHAPNEREIMWVKVEVSQLSFIGAREEVEIGERQKYNIHNTLVQSYKQPLKSL